MKYAFNEDGTYSISKNDTPIEDGTFTKQNDVTANVRGIGQFARAMREPSAKSVKYGYLLTPKNMGGAKASEKNPGNSKITVIKTENPGAIFGNTPMFTENDLKEIGEKPAVTVWIQAENLPAVSYNVTSDTTVEKVTEAISAKNENGRWFKYYFENCSEISLNVNYGNESKSFDITSSTVYISKNKEILTEKPEDFAFDEDYKSSSEKLYLMGTFAYQDEDAEQLQWTAIDNFNDFKEIDKNIYKLSMYLPQNIYGFKISMTGFVYDYCVPFDVKGSVPKNEWFNVVKSFYSKWNGKNGALATGGGYYNFFLDLSDEANPIMLVATDEQSDKVVEDENLYVVGDFTGWKFDEQYQLAETAAGSGIYSLTESVEIHAAEDGKPQGFKISDKTWGAMTGEYGEAWTRTENIALKENQYVDVDETYATKTQNNNLEYSFDGTYNFYLNVKTSQLKIENANGSSTPDQKIATIYFYDSDGNLTGKTHNVKVGSQITEEILNKYSPESDIFGWYIKDTNKKLDLPFTITSDLNIYPRVATTFKGGWVENYIGEKNVSAGNFYMCEIKGHTVTELNGWTYFATLNADSYGSQEFRWAADSDFIITSVCYAYNYGSASMSLKMENSAKVLIDTIEFYPVESFAEESEYGLSYGENYNKWQTLVASEETGNLECTLTLAAEESISGKFYNYTQDINLLYNSIEYVSTGLELTCEDDNSFTVKNASDNKDLNVTFSMNPTTLKVSLLLKDSMQQIELVGNYEENVIKTYDVEAGNFYKCTINGSSAIVGDNVIRSVLKTKTKDSISHGYNDDSSISFEQYLYAYETGKASLVLKSKNAGKILIESVEFEKLGTSLESDRFLLAYNDERASLSFKETENSNIKECTYFLGANSTFDGIISHQDYHFILLSNSIESYPSELTLSEKGDNLVIKNTIDTDLNLTFSLNTETLKVTLTAKEVSAPEIEGNWYSYEIDTTNFTAETISLIFNFNGAQTNNIENVQKSGVVYYEWDYSSSNYYISKKENKPSAENENEKLKVFVYTNAESCNLHYWGNDADSDYNTDWPGVTMTPVSTSAGE